MWILLLSVLLLSVDGDPLSVEENEKLQKTCGQTFLANETSAFKSMYTNISTRNEAPFTVLISHSKYDGTPAERLRESNAFCSGTVISPRHILTAAHCLAGMGFPKCNDKKLEEYTPALPLTPFGHFVLKLNYLIITAPTICNVSASCDTKMEPLIAKPKRGYIFKPYLNHLCSKPVGGPIRGDVGIIELEEDLDFTPTLQPACLNPKEPRFGERCTLYSYGSDESDVLTSAGILRKHEATTITSEECRKMRLSPKILDFLPEEDTFLQFRNTTPRIMADDLCAVNKTSQACSGDSGGGLVFKLQNKTFVTATVSFGPPCKPGFSPDGPVEINESIFLHYPWIWAVTGINPDGNDFAEEEREMILKYVHTFELHPSFDVELAKPYYPGQKVSRIPRHYSV